MRPCLTVFCALLPACLVTSGPDFAIENDDRAILYLVDSGGGPRLYAAASETEELAIALDPAERITALIYKHSLAELGLEAGLVALATSDEADRRVPAYHRAFERLAGSSSWSPLTERDQRFATVRLPALDVVTCVRGGGCTAASDQDWICKSPCETPPPLDEPAAPSPPILESGAPVDCGVWTPTTAFGLTTCRPPPYIGSSCPEGQVRFYFGDCQPLDVCPNAEWPELDAEHGAPYFVPEGASLDAQIAAANALGMPAVVVVGRGNFAITTTVALGPDVSLVGLCSAETKIELGADFALRGTNTNLRGVTLTGRTLSIDPSADSTIENVVFGASADIALIQFAGSKLQLKRVAIFDRGAEGASISGELSAEELLIERATHFGLRGDPSSRIELANSAIRGTIQSRPEDAIALLAAGHLDATGLELAANRTRALWLTGATAVLDQLILRGSETHPRGLAVVAGSTVTLTHAELAGFEAPLIVHDATLIATDVELREPTGSMAMAAVSVSVEQGARLNATRLRISGDWSTALSVATGTAAITALDISGGKDGLTAFRGGDIDVERAVFHRLSGVAALGTDPNTALNLDDVIARDVHEGFGAVGGAVTTIRRASIENFDGVAVFASGECALIDGSDLRASRGGQGVAISAGGSVSLSRVFISDLDTTGIDITARDAPDCPHRAAESVFTDLVIERGGEKGISVSRGAQLFLGHAIIENANPGIEVLGSLLEAERIIVRKNRTAGVWLGLGTDPPIEPPVVHIRQSSIEQNDVGLKLDLGDKKIDLAPLFDETTYRGNTAELELGP